jgi:site-specific recombinase XerD
MNHLYQRGLSRNNKGGTLKAYAVNISHLLRFCYENRIDPYQLSDTKFIVFVKSLETQYDKCLIRSKNSVLAISRNCLDFLDYVGRLNDDLTFISSEGKIKAERRIATITDKETNRSFVRSYWHHRVLPTPSALKKRFPISAKNIELLTNAAAKTIDTFARKRQFVMLKLLETTGCRRSELIGITLESLYSAIEGHGGLLKIPTSKLGGNKHGFRYVPMSVTDLKFLHSFAKYNRAPLIRKLGVTDPKTLLINARTGRPLVANTITQEIASLAKTAAIQERVSPHMFRHRFITQYFIRLIRQHKLENADDCRRLIINTNALKQKIQQYTGHKHISSLDHYIDLAFAEITNHQAVVDGAIRSTKIASIKRTIAIIKSELHLKQHNTEISELLNTLIDELGDLE